MTTIREVISHIDSLAPMAYQESYDNSGLIVGDSSTLVNNILICIDCTEEVVEEAVNKNCNLIISHHPILFKGLKSLTGRNYVERSLIKAIKNDVAIMAVHTNLDNVRSGVNHQIANELGLKNTKILLPISGNLYKLVTFVPQDSTDRVLDTLHEAGAGLIGNYSACSFRITGKGRFTPSSLSNPVIGSKGKPEEVVEDRLEIILPAHKKETIIKALRKAHPYEEVAYYLTHLDNDNQETGAGLIGSLETEMEPKEFLMFLKESMKLNTIRFTNMQGVIKTVAICGGSGAFLIKKAIDSKADALVTADVKYHEFFDGENALMICDIGHYESEVFTKELLCNMVTKKFTTFAVNLSEIDTNPINYFN